VLSLPSSSPFAFDSDGHFDYTRKKQIVASRHVSWAHNYKNCFCGQGSALPPSPLGELTALNQILARFQGKGKEKGKRGTGRGEEGKRRVLGETEGKKKQGGQGETEEKREELEIVLNGMCYD